ncbi:hypothetical protein TNCV_108101 [Trichonephila clavipes]|nr:hypothetical protein TNCV_108101 [Trichonephila clavipes]
MSIFLPASSLEENSKPRLLNLIATTNREHAIPQTEILPHTVSLIKNFPDMVLKTASAVQMPTDKLPKIASPCTNCGCHLTSHWPLAFETLKLASFYATELKYKFS